MADTPQPLPAIPLNITNPLAANGYMGMPYLNNYTYNGKAGNPYSSLDQQIGASMQQGPRGQQFGRWAFAGGNGGLLGGGQTPAGSGVLDAPRTQSPYYTPTTDGRAPGRSAQQPIAHSIGDQSPTPALVPGGRNQTSWFGTGTNGASSTPVADPNLTGGYTPVGGSTPINNGTAPNQFRTAQSVNSHAPTAPGAPAGWDGFGGQSSAAPTATQAPTTGSGAYTFTNPALTGFQFQGQNLPQWQQQFNSLVKTDPSAAYQMAYATPQAANISARAMGNGNSATTAHLLEYFQNGGQQGAQNDAAGLGVSLTNPNGVVQPWLQNNIGNPYAQNLPGYAMYANPNAWANAYAANPNAATNWNAGK